jgi:type I restriction-modification system DNA methylase subunit
MSTPSTLVQKLWNYCNILRDDGLSYGDYVEQLTYLLFLKMADEQSRPPFNKLSPIPKGKDWPTLLAKDGDELETHYRHTLEELCKRSGTATVDGYVNGWSFSFRVPKVGKPSRIELDATLLHAC